MLADRDCAWNLTANADIKQADMVTYIWLDLPISHLIFCLLFRYQSNICRYFSRSICNQPEHLDDAYIAYLKRFAPIGCRDIATRDLLMNQGIDAFFSGCVTTTLALAGEAETSGDEILDGDANIKEKATKFTPVYRGGSERVRLMRISLTHLRFYGDSVMPNK